MIHSSILKQIYVGCRYSIRFKWDSLNDNIKGVPWYRYGTVLMIVPVSSCFFPLL
jgi:hypothetical protein